jgi:hypothetical protein
MVALPACPARSQGREPFHSPRSAARVRPVKQLWTGRAIQAAEKYGEHAPMATVCCNACRTCVTTNIISIATTAIAAMGVGLTRFGSRIARPS